MSIYPSPILMKMLQEERLREVRDASRVREALIREAHSGRHSGAARRPAFAEPTRRLFVRRPAAAESACSSAC
jgi:hypothetical protein